MRGRRHVRSLVDRIPNPRLAGSGRRPVRLPQVRYADGGRPEGRVRVRRRRVAQHDINSRQLLRDALVCGSRVFCQKVSRRRTLHTSKTALYNDITYHSTSIVYM